MGREGQRKAGGGADVQGRELSEIWRLLWQRNPALG